jgi:hypothetical protein
MVCVGSLVGMLIRGLVMALMKNLFNSSARQKLLAYRFERIFKPV